MNIEISASLRKEIQKTFAFIIDEGRRLQAVLLEYKTSRVRPSQTDGFDLFFCFGNNTSNRFPVGKAALTRFNALCERIVIDIGVSNQLSADIFSQVFANEFLKTSSEDTADNFDLRIDECIKKSLVESLPKTEASVHYLPINCEFKDGPEQFAIGSYTLHKGKQFAAQLPQVLSSDSHLGEDELSNLVNYYSKFGTVVEIPLHAADGEKSR